MRGVVYLGDGALELRDFPDPEPGPGEVVVRVRASGLCGSDLHHYHGPARQAIAGHEPCGVVASIGPGVSPNVAGVGDRVIVHHYKGCTACRSCRCGWPQMCTRAERTVYGLTAHGSHAEFMLVPAESLVALDDALSFEAGAAIGCGTGTAWRALKRLGSVSGTTLAVFGQGPVGLSATMLASALGARVVALDISPDRLELARRFGAWETVDVSVTDAAAAVRELTRGEGANLTLETSGAATAGADAVEVLADWGRACFVGLGESTATLEVQRQFRRQLTVMTSWTMSVPDLFDCSRFVAERALPMDDIFTHRWALEDAAQAYAEFDKQSAGKGVFVL
jgi:threonine dehydrogenase-like Zn-dependent dehydrogenase